MSAPHRPGGLLAGEPHDGRLEALVGRAASAPRPRERYDLVVIGGGTAGLVSAHGAAALGARVALVERELLGGDCLVTGCVPSKALLRSARAVAEVRAAAEVGVEAGSPSVRFADVMTRLRRLRADIAPADSAERLARAGVDVFFGQARFVDGAAIDVDGARLSFARAILAVGARPAIPDVPGLAALPHRTSESIFALTELPPRLLVLGGGPIGCELAQAFARLGSEVTLVHRESRLLPKDDADAAAVVEAALARDGVRVMLGATARSFAPGRALIERGGAEESVGFDEVLVATGRVPRGDDMDLGRAGIAFGPDGIVVDDFLCTTNRRVLAAGDCASRQRFTHAADALARVAVQNALMPVRARASRLVIPWCTFTDPEVAHAGVSAEQARERGDVATFTVPLAEVDRAILDGATEGFFRVHAERRSGRLLGATIVAPGAGESIAEAVALMRLGQGLGALGATVHCYPTVTDGLRRAAGQWQRSRLRPWMTRWIARWLRLSR